MFPHEKHRKLTLFIQLSAQKKSWRQEAKLVNVSSHVSHDTKQLMALSSFDHGVSAFNSVLRLALGRPEGHIVARQRQIGIYSHMVAQRSALKQFFEDSHLCGSKHAIIAVVSDDTNIWVNNPSIVHEDSGVAKARPSQQRGMKKMQSLAMLQTLVLRDASDDNGPGKLARILFFSTSTDAVWAWCPGHR